MLYHMEYAALSKFKSLIRRILQIPSKLSFYLFSISERAITKLTNPEFAYSLRNTFLERFDNEQQTVTHKRKQDTVTFKLHTPNQTCLFRQKTFSSKEPELLEWLDQYGGDGAFFDIGSNIGIYSIYYAKTNPGKVYSFEPSIFNLKQLGKNISANNLSNQITVVPNPLSDKTGYGNFKVAYAEEGRARNTFNVDYGFDGNPIDVTVDYGILGFTLDDLLEKDIITEPPSLIKIDVDGIEHLILGGSKKTLQLKSLKSILVEVNDDFDAQRKKVKTLLEASGFKLALKKHSVITQNNAQLAQTHNQIWVRAKNQA